MRVHHVNLGVRDIKNWPLVLKVVDGSKYHGCEIGDVLLYGRISPLVPDSTYVGIIDNHTTHGMPGIGTEVYFGHGDVEVIKDFNEEE